MKIAVGVAELAYERELATVPKPDDLSRFIQSQVYEPEYPTYC